MRSPGQAKAQVRELEGWRARTGFLLVVSLVAARAGTACSDPATGGTGKLDAAVADVSETEAGADARLIFDGFAPVWTCGNGVLDFVESCDDGNRLGGDGCSPLCQIEGDGIICDSPGRPCIVPSPCGNGVRAPNEACDDGNTANGDGCDGTCTAVEPGWICPRPGQRCSPLCGDGIVTPPEQCDDSGSIDGDGCSAHCLSEPSDLRCGDGIVSGSESCDAGSANDDGSYGGCTTKCAFGAHCGDGTTNGPETCDLGLNNTAHYGTEGCSPECRRPHYCGDAIVDSANGEQCDHGTQTNPVGAFCTSDCHIILEL